MEQDDEINAELQMMADEARQEVVDAQYEDMMDELSALMADYTMADDCSGPWYWERY